MLDDPRSPAGLEWHARFPLRFAQLPRFTFLVRGEGRGAQGRELRNYLHGNTLALIGAIRFWAAASYSVLVENYRSTRAYGLPEWPLRRHVWLHRPWGRFKLKPLTRVIPNAALGPPLKG